MNSHMIQNANTMWMAGVNTACTQYEVKLQQKFYSEWVGQKDGFIQHYSAYLYIQNFYSIQSKLKQTPDYTCTNKLISPLA